MSLELLLIIGVVGCVLIALTLYAINRSWGDFPNGATLSPRDLSAYQTHNQREIRSNDWFADPPTTAPPDAPPPADTDLVLITNPLIRQVAEQALQRGGNVARAIVRQGDQLYFSFAHISDPAQRRAAYDLLRRIEAGEQVDLRKALSVIRQMV